MADNKKRRSSSDRTGKRVSYHRVESMASEADSIKEVIGEEDVEAIGKEEEELDEQIEDNKIGRQVVLAIVIICLLLLLGMIDSMTTKYCKRASTAFALWTVRNAPWAFLVYMFVIIVLIICCLPYGKHRRGVRLEGLIIHHFIISPSHHFVFCKAHSPCSWAPSSWRYTGTPTESRWASFASSPRP